MVKHPVLENILEMGCGVCSHMITEKHASTSKQVRKIVSEMPQEYYRFGEAEEFKNSLSRRIELKPSIEELQRIAEYHPTTTIVKPIVKVDYLSPDYKRKTAIYQEKMFNSSHLRRLHGLRQVLINHLNTSQIHSLATVFNERSLESQEMALLPLVKDYTESLSYKDVIKA